MKTVSIDCAGIVSPAVFWQRYIEVVQPEGAGYFGRNLDAFRDALNGGPGWPGEVGLLFENVAGLNQINEGKFLAALQEIASSSSDVQVRFQ